MSKKKKILLLGSKGMAGHVIYYYFKNHADYDLIDVARSSEFFDPSYKLDLTDFTQLGKILDYEIPDVVINCIGVLNNDAETHPDKAILLNSYMPHYLAGRGVQLQYKVIHISTDCVFNGKKGGYKKDDIKDGFGFYAQSKALGEINYGNNLTLRTSIVGPELKHNGIGLFDWFMNQSGNIKGYSRAYWTGVTTIELAHAIKAAIEQDLTGLHHLVNDAKISKFDLLGLFKTIFNRDDINIIASGDYHVDKSLVVTDPVFQYEVPTYKKMIEDMKLWMITHQHLYYYKLTD